MAVMGEFWSFSVQALAGLVTGLESLECLVYFSELADLKGRLALKLDIDWEYVAMHVVAPIRQSRATAFRNVASLEGGDCDEISKGCVTTHRCWSPVSFARIRHQDIEGCIRRARETMTQSVHAWASCHSNIVLSLSGGLDSPIVLACLMSAPTDPSVTCATLYGDEDGADESDRLRDLL